MNRDVHEVQNLATEKVVGLSSRSIRNWDRSTRGVESVIKGCTRALSTVGTISVVGQSQLGRARRVARVFRRDPPGRVVEVRMSRVRTRSSGARIRPLATAAAAATQRDAQG